jgi:uncharacterized protein YceH (UPF0502 family)
VIKADRDLLKAELKEAMKIDRSQPKPTGMYLSLVAGLGTVARHACNLHDHLSYLVEANHAETKARADKLEQRLSALTKRMNALEKS